MKNQRKDKRNFKKEVAADTPDSSIQFMNDLFLGVAGLYENEHGGNCQLLYASNQ